MESVELIEKLAIVGCALYGEQATAHQLAHYSSACRLAFDFSGEQLNTLLSHTIEHCREKVQ
jgi:hypothetical protein